MSAEIGVPALSMLESLSSLKITPLVMHRIHIEISNTTTWYAVMQEARTWFGKNWKTQPHVRKKLSRYRSQTSPINVWFDVPDPKFGTWVAVKLAVRIVEAPTKY